MCGIIAVYSETNSAQKVYQGLLQLQHRGQDAAGIAFLEPELKLMRGVGRIKDIFLTPSFDESVQLAIGHTRYITSGGSVISDSQPFSHEKGVALAHSGHLKNDLWMSDFNNAEQSQVDSNLLLQLLVQRLEKSHYPDEEDVFLPQLIKAVTSLMQEVKGAYSVVSLIKGKGLLVFRDPQGIRPLTFGSRLNSQAKQEYIFASESHFFADLGFQLQGEVEAGELVFIDLKGQLFREILKNKPLKPCSFEYVYFAHPQSAINGILVDEARKKMGTLLAHQWQATYSHLTPDFVLPIPHTAKTAAQTFARYLNLNLGDYFKLNHTVGRTFIQASNQKRIEGVNRKLSIDAQQIKNKRILLFDDSIVRGTTVRELIKKLHQSGAKAIYLASACPPIINSCSYGINIPNKEELLAGQYSQEEMKTTLNLEALIFLNRKNLLKAISLPKHKGSPCVNCMILES